MGETFHMVKGGEKWKGRVVSKTWEGQGLKRGPSEGGEREIK